MAKQLRTRSTTEELLLLPTELNHEAAKLLKYFSALSPKHQSLAVRVLRALWKTQGEGNVSRPPAP